MKIQNPYNHFKQMRIFLETLFICILSSTLMGQSSNVSVELNYPLAVDENFIGTNYNGIIDAGIKHRFSYFDKIAVGISLNTSVFKNAQRGLIIESSDLTAFILQPKFFIETNGNLKAILKPFAGVGYGIILYNFSRGQIPEGNIDSVSSIPASDDTQSGLNLNAGFFMPITDRLSFQVQYDFIRLFSEEKLFTDNYNRDVHLIKFGLAFRFKKK